MRTHLFRALCFACLLMAITLTWLNRDRLTAEALTSFITMAPGAFAYAYLGDAGREAVSGGPDLVRKGLLAVAVLAAVALLPSLIRHWRRPGTISPQQLQTLLAHGDVPLVLDVRNRDEFVGERGHITGAVLSPLPELDAKIDELKRHRTHPIVTV